MFKFLHAADVHLDSPLKGLERYLGAPADEIRGATRRAFDNLVDLAIQEDVAFLLLAGDLYDGDWKDYNTGLFFVSRMRRLEEAGIPVFLISGNHDAASQITKVLRPPGNVRVLGTKKPETARLDSLEVAIHGQGFASQSVSEDLSAGYPDAVPHFFNIGLLHTSLDGRPGHASYAPCTLVGLRSKGYQYWALGHVHEPEIVCQDPWVVFPGILQGRHVREAGPKGAVLVTVEDREVVTIESQNVDVFRWTVCRVKAAGAATAGEVLDRVGKALERELAAADGRPLAARLVIEGACPAHEELVGASERWIQECRGLAAGFGEGKLWIEKVRFETRRSGDLRSPFDGDDALGGLLRSLRDLREGQGSLEPLPPELADLKRKLPVELFADGDALDPTDPGQLRDLLPEVEDLLLARLLATPEASEA
jgi:exonuclease SbcD